MAKTREERNKQETKESESLMTEKVGKQYDSLMMEKVGKQSESLMTDKVGKQSESMMDKVGKQSALNQNGRQQTKNTKQRRGLIQ